MFKFLRMLMLCVVLACASCGGSANQTSLVIRDATVSANSQATTLETMQSLALIFYRTEQELAIAAAVNAGENKQQAVERVAKVRKQWIVVWDTFAKARASYSILSSIVQSASDNSGAVQSAVNDLEQKMTDVRNAVGVARSRIQGGTQ